MSVGKHRTPVRPLGSTNLAMAYPGELLVDPDTGNFVYLTESKEQVFHNKPGTLTVKQGTKTILNNGDLSTDLVLQIPEAESSAYPTTFAWKNGTTTGPTGTLSLSDGSSVSFPAIPIASTSQSGVVTTGDQFFKGNKNFIQLTADSLTINTPLGTSGIAYNVDSTLSTNWTGSSAPYSQRITVTGVTSSDRPIIDFRPSGTYATDQTAEEAWLNVYRAVTSSGSITFYAHDKPTVAIPIQIKLIR